MTADEYPPQGIVYAAMHNCERVGHAAMETRMTRRLAKEPEDPVTPVRRRGCCCRRRTIGTVDVLTLDKLSIIDSRKITYTPASRAPRGRALSASYVRDAV